MNNKELIIRYFNKNDLNKITQLLEENDLPAVDLVDSKVKFILAEKDDLLIGCIGLESYGTEGFLRSFAVSQNFRSLGIGNELYQALLNYANQTGIINLHLLTTTAEKYFEKKGFEFSERTLAPESIKATTEFSTLCAKSSSYMVLEDILRIG